MRLRGDNGGNQRLWHTSGMPPVPALLLLALPVAAMGLGLGYWLGRRRGAASNATIERQRAELQALAGRVITLQEDERSALSRELHDDIGQAITAIKLCAMALVDERGAAPGIADDGDEGQLRATALEIAQIADETVVKLRNLSLLLRPPQLDALGLEAALRWQAGALFRSARPELTLDLSPLPRRPAPAVELACFRIAQEALTNTLRHAQANHVRVTLAADDGRIDLCVDDDGRGFDRGRGQGLGLVTMRERARQLGGTLDIGPGAHGGTRVRACLPMDGR